jgi:hypothetical protein
MGAGSLQPPVHSPAWYLQPVASHFQAVCVVHRFFVEPWKPFFGCRNDDDWIGGMAQLALSMCGNKCGT